MIPEVSYNDPSSDGLETASDNKYRPWSVRQSVKPVQILRTGPSLNHEVSVQASSFPQLTALNLEEKRRQKLASTNSQVTTFLEGGLPFGAVTEIGCPLGCEGRPLLLSFLAQASKEERPILWVHTHQELKLFPPAWFARGIDPKHIVFSVAKDPVSDLKRAFLNPFFSVIVADLSKGLLSAEECAFLSTRARVQRQAIILIRPYFLTNKLGNPWTPLRLNMSKWSHRYGGEGPPSRQAFSIQIVRGQSKPPLILKGDPS